ncbi:MAG: DUF5343 domain-containing protein [Xanthobacteraceae bacterium]
MPVTAAKPAPYATAGSLLDLLVRNRDRGLPSPVTAEVLGRAGIPDSLIPRTLQALQTLDLIDKDGAPTQTLEGLRLAPEAEYRDRLAAWLKAAYADIFAFVDPMKDDATRIRDAFRSYEPRGQQDRMVSLFQGLCAAAGLMPEKIKVPTPGTPPRAPSRPTPKPPTRQPVRITARTRDHSSRHDAALPAPLTGLLASLPPDGEGWSQDRRDRFFAAFGTVLDLCFPVASPADAQPEEDETA